MLTCSDGHPPYAVLVAYAPSVRSAKKKHASTLGPRGVLVKGRRDDVFRLGRMAKEVVQHAEPSSPARSTDDPAARIHAAPRAIDRKLPRLSIHRVSRSRAANCVVSCPPRPKGPRRPRKNSRGV